MKSFLARLTNWKISKRLWVMASLAILALVAASLLGFWNLYYNSQLRQKAMSDATHVMHAVELARGAQVHFKKQVQEWKNVLLRAHEANLYEKYWQSFEKEEAIVLEKLASLKTSFIEFGLDASLVEAAIRDHEELGKKYRAALAGLVRGNFATSFATDRAVRGIDRIPTDNIDLLVKVMEEAQQRRIVDNNQRAEESLKLTIFSSLTAALLAMVFLFGISWFTINSITQPIDQTIAIFKEISEDNLDNPVELNRQDEIGEMWRALHLMQTKLKDRTQALNKANESLQHMLHQVQLVKEKQDGDYFLTSLLLEPLSSVNVSAKEISVFSILEQKKKFNFRKWNKEIGGDINIVDEIILKDKKYLLALNADAMGKSMQGAGGALVMGAVFRSIIERTKMSSTVSQLYPERWLKNTWTEIQKVFESFHGSMLVSGVIVLLDYDTGTLYSINAEHPYPVLMRDGKAEFLFEEYSSRKFGTLGIEQELQVSVKTLLPGDILILGSDGRDDLMLSEDKKNYKINEDEALFLRIATLAQGDHQKLLAEIRRHGEITDDLSLIVIHYHGAPEIAFNSNHEEVKQVLTEFQRNRAKMQLEEIKLLLKRLYQNFPRHAEVCRHYFVNLLSLKEYSLALPVGLEYSALQPGDDEALYLVSYAAKMSGNYEIAVDFGERLRLRQGYWLKNLLNLADVYALKKDFSRAKKILEEVHLLDPKNEKAKKIQKALQDLAV